MSNNQKLLSLKELLKESWQFFTTNWRKFVAFFLVLEIPILVFGIANAFIDSDTDSVFLLCIASIISILGGLIVSFKKIAILGSGLLASDISEYKGGPTVKYVYKEIFRKLIPLAWVMILTCLCFFSVFFISSIVGVLLFALPFLALNPISNMAGGAEVFLHGGFITLSLCFIIFFGIFVVHLLFFTYTYFASYSTIMENRRGLDAIVASYMYVRGRVWKILVRIILISLIALIPGFLLVGPAATKISYDQVLVLKESIAKSIEPVFVNNPYTHTWLIFGGFIASMISGIWFSSSFYTLWKDIKSTSIDFDEKTYTRLRNILKVLSWFGILAIIIFVIGSMILAGFLYETFLNDPRFAAIFFN